jgi:hypothetical protein
MERMPEMLTSFSELNRVMDKMGQMNLMGGVRDAGEFMKKFQTTIGTLKDMSKMMGTTMEGALQAFGEQRQAGFYSKGDILRNTMNAQITGAVTGMGTQKVVQMQQAGGELAHAMGGSRKSGANMMARNLSQLGMANQMGILTNDQIMEMTGKEGAAGISDIAGQMSELSYKMAQSAPGTLLTLGLAETGEKGYTGKMDQGLADKVRRGEISLAELKKISRDKLGKYGRGGKLFYGAHGKRMRAEMAGAVGAEGQGMMLQEILGSRGWDNPDATNLVMQRFGATEEQANLLQQMMPNLDNIGSELRANAKTEATSRARQSLMKERYSSDAIKHKLKKRIEHLVTDPLKDAGRAIRDYVNDYVEGFTDDLTGQYTTTVTKGLVDALKGTAGGSKASATRLAAMQSAARKVTQGMGGDRLDVGSIGGLRGIASKGMHLLSGTQTRGERLTTLLAGLDGGKYLTRGNTEELAASGATVLSGADATTTVASLVSAGGLSKQGAALTQENRKKAIERLRSLSSDKGGLEQYNAMESMERELTVADMIKAHATGELDPTKMKGTGRTKGAGVAIDVIRNKYYAHAMTAEVLAETDEGKKADMIYRNMKKAAKAGGDENYFAELEKKGFSGVAVVAGIQAKERSLGRKYAGAAVLDPNMLSDLGGNQVKISQQLKAHNKEMMKKYKQDEKSLGWAEIQKLVDSGDELATILTGGEGGGGLMEEDDEGQQGMGGKRGGSLDLRDALNGLQGGTDFSDLTRGQKAALAKVGFKDATDAKRLSKRLQEDPSLLPKLAGLQGKGGAKDLLTYAGLSAASGLAENAKQVNAEGQAVADRLTQRSGDVDVLKGSKEGAAFIESLTASSNAAIGLTNSADMADWTDKKAKMDFETMQHLKGLKGEHRERAENVAGEQLTEAAKKNEALEKKLSGKTNRKLSDSDLDSIMADMGYGTDTGLGDYQKKKAELESSIIGTDRVINNDELKALVEKSGKESTIGLRAAETGKSAYMSEEEVAKQLGLMSQNAKDTAQLLTDIVTKKPLGTEGSTA